MKTENYVEPGDVAGQEPSLSQEAPLGIGTGPALSLDWRARRAGRNHVRHLCCANRTGAKIVPGIEGPIVVETAG